MIDNSHYINSAAYQLDHLSGPTKANKNGDGVGEGGGGGGGGKSSRQSFII